MDGELKNLSYRKIKKEYGAPYGKGSVFIDFYACALSPIFTRIALRLKLIPNTVTIGMILSGIIGAVVFWVPGLHFKIIGTIFIHLWFILDCSDGEVARATKHFSNHGEELDYMAHTFNHPLFTLSFLIAYILDYNLDLWIITAFVLTLAADVAMRMVYMMLHVDTLKTGTSHSVRWDKSEWTVREMIVFVINIFAQFPNFALIYPVIYLINHDWGKIYLYINSVIAVIYCYVLVIKWIKNIHKQ